MKKWYTLYSFVTNASNPTEDLSAFFEEPGVADACRENVEWRLVDGESNEYWIGDVLNEVTPRGTLTQGGAPNDFIFRSPSEYTVNMKLQVQYVVTPSPSPPPCCKSLGPKPQVCEPCGEGGDGGCTGDSCVGGGPPRETASFLKASEPSAWGESGGETCSALPPGASQQLRELEELRGFGPAEIDVGRGNLVMQLRGPAGRPLGLIPPVTYNSLSVYDASEGFGWSLWRGHFPLSNCRPAFRREKALRTGHFKVSAV